MSRFNYKGRDAKTVKDRANQKGGDFDSILSSTATTVKISEGDHTFRILPPTWSPKKWGDNWGIEVWAHGNVGADNASYLCPKKMNEEDCVICDALEDMDAEDAKEMKAKKRILAYIIDRDNQKAGPLVWNLGWQMEKDIQVRCLDKKTGEAIAIDHPDNGYDISFRREGQGLKTRYNGVDVDRDETPISENDTKQEKWLTYITENPLPDLLVFHDQDYVEKILMGKKSSKKDEDEDEDEDERPSRTKKKASAKKGRDEDEEDEDEEDEKPSRSKSKSKARDEDEDEDEDERPHRKSKAKDEDEDEEDEDEKPSRTKRKARVKDEDEEDEEEEDERPTRAKSAAKSTKRSAHSADEDEDEDEDEEDEDEKPSRSKSKSKARDEDEDEDEDEEESSTASARKKLERLKPKGKR